MNSLEPRLESDGLSQKGYGGFVLIGGLQLALTALLLSHRIKADKSLSIRFALCDHFAVTSNIINVAK